MNHHRLGRPLRFLVAGGSGALLHLSLLYALTGYLGVWYLASATLAFIVAFVWGFLLQKYWTFGDASRERVVQQAVLYLCVGLGNLILNAALVYGLVEYGGVHYLLAQALVIALLATGNFFIYHAIFPPEGV